MLQTKNATRQIMTRLAPLYAAAFFHGFVLWYAIEKLFMRSIGYNDAGIGIMVAAYSALMLVLETPSGILADRWSRKGVLMLSSATLAICAFVGGISTEPLLYIVCALFWGVSYAFYSGTYDTIVYDLMVEEKGDASEFPKYYGYVQIADSVALVLGALVGGAMSQWLGMRATYFWSVPIALVTILFLWRFKEPLLHKAEALGSVKEQITETFKAVLGARSLLSLLMVIITITLILDVMYEFSQLWLIAIDTPVVWFGPAFALVLATGGVGGYLAGKVKARRPAMVTLFVAVGLSGLVLAYMHELWAVVIAQTVLMTALNTLSVLLLNDLHNHLPSRVRSGASSAVNTIGRLALIPLSLVFGWLSASVSIFAAAWLIVALVMIAAIFELVPRKQTSTT